MSYYWRAASQRAFSPLFWRQWSAPKIHSRFTTLGSPGPRQKKIEKLLGGETEIGRGEKFSPLFLRVQNESHMHSVPPGSESHFKVVIVDKIFEGKRRVARHQFIYRALDNIIKEGVHALSLITMTPQEFEDDPDLHHLASPNCLGGSKKDPKN